MPKSKSKKNKSVQKKQSSLGEKIAEVLFSYLTSQFLLMILVGIASWGILTLLHVKYAVLLGIITGVLSGVPGFGMLVATIISAIVAIMDGVAMWTNSPAWLEGLIIFIIFFIFNKIVDLIIAPIILGKVTKINPLIVLLLVIAGTILFGIPGAILAVPLYLVIKTAVEYFKDK